MAAITLSKVLKFVRSMTGCCDCQKSCPIWGKKKPSVGHKQSTSHGRWPYLAQRSQHPRLALCAPLPRCTRVQVLPSKTQNLNLEPRHPTSEIQNPKPEFRNPKPEIRNPKPKTRNSKPEAATRTRNPNPKPNSPHPKAAALASKSYLNISSRLVKDRGTP